jgi:leucyl-tRNA synthetase
MDTFVDSSWYFLRYVSPHRDDVPFDPLRARRWLPVDHYLGGSEHATLHLIYARFITKVLHDLGHIEFDEPFTKLVHQGQILGSDGLRMSKSRGNTVSPDDYLGRYGSDTLRLYCFFLGPYTEGGSWNDRGIAGTWRFINRLWDLIQPPPAGGDHDEQPAAELRSKVHRTIRQVSEDLPAFQFNTVVSDLMKLENAMSGVPAEKRRGPAWAEAQEMMVRLLAPFAPHLADELWERLGHPESVHVGSWPEYDASLLAEAQVALVVQVNGKVRERLTIAATLPDEEVKKIALAAPKVAALLAGKEPLRVILVGDRSGTSTVKLVNVVI